MASKGDYHWTFGNRRHTGFAGGGALMAAPDQAAINTDEGCASVSDSDENLRFYTDGRGKDGG